MLVAVAGCREGIAVQELEGTSQARGWVTAAVTGSGRR
jgi:hypothetical protein